LALLTTRSTSRRRARIRVLGLSRNDLKLLQACLGFQARQQCEPSMRGRLLRLRQKLAVLEAVA
jgi:hypothetical protein